MYLQNISSHWLQSLPNMLKSIKTLLWQRTPTDTLLIRPDLLDRTGPKNNPVRLFQRRVVVSPPQPASIVVVPIVRIVSSYSMSALCSDSWSYRFCISLFMGLSPSECVPSVLPWVSRPDKKPAARTLVYISIA